MTECRILRLIAAGVLSVAAAFGADRAAAAAITLIHEGSASGGTLEGVPFGPVTFVITASGDTGNIESSGSVLSLDHDSAEIAISGLGTFDFITGTRTFVNQASPIVGFSRATLAGLDLFNGPTDPVFGSYDLASDIGPVSGLGTIVQWTFNDVETSGGTLNFDAFQTDAAFTARVSPIPLPAPALLMAGALAALTFLRRDWRQ